MKQIKKTLALLIAVALIAALAPAAFAYDPGDVIFEITQRKAAGSGGNPLADGLTAVDVDSAYVMNGSATDASGDYEALTFKGNSKTPDRDGVNFGINFGEDISAYIPDPAQAFLTMEFTTEEKGRFCQAYVGSMYQDSGVWVKREPVSLDKYISFATGIWRTLEFPLTDLGLSEKDNTFEGIYFTFDNVTLTNAGELWEVFAKAFDVAVVSSVGANTYADMIPDAGETIDLKNDTTLSTATAVLPGLSTSAANNGVWMFSSWSKGLAAANNGAAEGDTAYYRIYAKNKNTFSTVATSNIKNYDLVMDIKKGTANPPYVKDIEVGFSNAFITSTDNVSDISKMPSVVKTYPLDDFGYAAAANGTVFTGVTASVKDILENGTEATFAGTGTVATRPVNNLSDSNINAWLVKATYNKASTNSSAQILVFNNIKLVRSVVTLTDETVPGGDVSWSSPVDPVCYKVYETDGTFVCNTKNTYIENSVGESYKVYAYFGNGIYSNELDVVSVPAPTLPSISDYGDDIAFDLADTVSPSAVAIVAGYNAGGALQSLTVTPFGNESFITTAKPSGVSTIKAFMFDSLSSLLPLAPAYSE